jgi:hypothetical protein
MRDELLNESLFLDLDQARHTIAAWIADYNTARPHSSLGYKTPAAYADHLTATGHRAPLHEGSARWPGCSHRAKRRNNSRGSNRRWMKVQWQVIGFIHHSPVVEPIGTDDKPRAWRGLSWQRSRRGELQSYNRERDPS